MPAAILLRRLATDDSGQDLVEYALLGALVGVAGIAAYQLILGSLAVSYAAWDTNVQALWNMPSPGGS